MEKPDKVIIISGNKTFAEYLMMIFKFGKTNDRIIIKYIDRYAELVDALLFGLRKSFGWLQVGEVKRIEDENRQCIFYNCEMIYTPGEKPKRSAQYGLCTNKESNYQRCDFHVREICQKYKQKDNKKFFINEVIIEKHGAIKGI